MRWRQVYPISTTKGIYNTKENQCKGPLGQNNPRLVRMHQMSMGVRCCTDSLHNTQKRIMGAAHTRTVNYEIRDPALRVGGG